MPNINPAIERLTAKIKATPLEAPWSVLTKQAIYAEKYQHPLRANTRPVQVSLLGPVLNAALYYVRTEKMQNIQTAYRLVKADKKYIAEMTLMDNTGFVASYDSGSGVLEATMIRTDGTQDSISSFQTAREEFVTGICLVLLQEIIKTESDCDRPILTDIFSGLGEELEQTELWSSEKAPQESDFPDSLKEKLYSLDIVTDVISEMNIQMGPSNVPEALNPEFFDGTDQLSGKLLVENHPEKIRFVQVKGKERRISSPAITLKEARAAFSVYTKDRVWTEAEKMLIPDLPEDMPVMEEVLMFARRIIGTHKHKNPCVNFMWRGGTSYGKSTGVEQLAYVLHIPLLRMTCHPSMEAQDFKSTFVPETEKESIALRTDGITPGESAETTESAGEPPYFKEAMSHVLRMPEAERKAFLADPSFFTTAMMDTDNAYNALLGFVPDEVDFQTACWLYSEVAAAVREMPLRADIRKMREGKQEKSAERNSPNFRHVVSNYVKAMVNGYLVEIQECSRVRDSGVLVSLNEFDRPGAVIPLMNGGLARRHPDALCFYTDNVGYASCRPIDPSVLRRMAMIRDSSDLPKKTMLARIRWNTGCQDTDLLNKAYKVWKDVLEYCRTNDITDGSISATELERFIQAVMLDGMDSWNQNLNDCIISKATSNAEDQKDIRIAISI